MKTILAASIAACALAGCAGLVAPFVNNPYAGTYNGTFTDSENRAGPASLSLTNIGNVFGKLTDTKSGAAGTFTGSVDTNLNLNGTVKFPSVSHYVSGTFTKASSGKIAGTLKSTDGYSITFDMNPKA